MSDDCVFCGIVAGRLPSATVAEDKGKDRLELPFEPGVPADPDVLAERAAVLAAALGR